MLKEEGSDMTPLAITVPDLAEQTGKSRNTIYEWAKRETDPLPLRFEKGTRKDGFIVVEEFLAWWSRNSVHYKERFTDG